MRLALVVLAACGPSKPPGPPPKPRPPAEDPSLLATLPKPAPIDTERFTSVVVCDRCHTPGTTAMRDSKGVDISPVTEIQAGMMSLAGRDPYYLAALRREIVANPGAKAAIEATCNRCHAPIGFAESNGTLTLDDLTSATTPAASLGREGIGCAGCHGLEPDKLGDESSFTGAQPLRGDRVAFGRLRQPLGEVMVQMSKHTPKPSDHIGESRLCASCHTVLVHRLDASGKPTGNEVPEQTTFLEWRASAFAAGPNAKTCQGCHMPATEDELGQGTPIETPFATRPPDAPPRKGYRRHALRGGNSYLLRRLADHAAWLNAPTRPELLRAAADATDRFLTSAAELKIAKVDRRSATIAVINRTGHKLPTGYPTRRMWLHATVRDAGGAVLAEWGGHRDGALIDHVGKRIDGPGAITPHRSTLDAPGQVVIWEAVPVDAQGKRTHLLLGTAGIVKDNRILPAGWKKTHPDAARTKPIGVVDPDFVAGQDTIKIVLPAGAARLELELLYQPIPPETIESYAKADGKEAARFLAIVATPPAPAVLAATQLEIE